jgi:hypothetical protein
MDESDLIRKAQEGEGEALSSIFREHEDDLRGISFKILKNTDDVEDALQAVRIKVWQKIGTFDPVEVVPSFGSTFLLADHDMIPLDALPRTNDPVLRKLTGGPRGALREIIRREQGI